MRGEEEDKKREIFRMETRKRKRSLQRHSTKTSKQVFLERNFAASVPISTFMYSCICELFIYSQVDRSAFSVAGKYVNRFWEYINRSQTHECGNWD
jgi:hypothetical protein